MEMKALPLSSPMSWMVQMLRPGAGQRTGHEPDTPKTQFTGEELQVKFSGDFC
jgi:hypothetical protein